MSHTEYAELHWRPVSLRLVGGGLTLSFVLCLIGWAITANQSWALFAKEAQINVWAADHRTDAGNLMTMVWSNMADTKVCIAVLVLGIVVFRLWLGRWRECWALLAAIVGELWVFLIVTALVGRDRPAVEQLDLAPPTSSFPSGHTAAAVALYGCIAIVLLRELHPRWLAIILAILLGAIPVLVGTSRLYRGMHHTSDVVFGMIGGGIWLAIVVTTLLARKEHQSLLSTR